MRSPFLRAIRPLPVRDEDAENAGLLTLSEGLTRHPQHPSVVWLSPLELPHSPGPGPRPSGAVR